MGYASWLLLLHFFFRVTFKHQRSEDLNFLELIEGKLGTWGVHNFGTTIVKAVFDN